MIVHDDYIFISDQYLFLSNRARLAIIQYELQFKYDHISSLITFFLSSSISN